MSENYDTKLADLEAKTAKLEEAAAKLEKLAQPAERKADFATINVNTKFGGQSVSPETKAFVTWMITGKKSLEMKTLTEGTSTAGGIFTPDEFRKVLIEKIFKQSVIRGAGATVVPMSVDTMTLPVQGALMSASWIGENVSVPLADPDFTNVTLTAHKLAVRTQITSELEEDSSAIIDVADYVANAMATAFALEEDSKFVNGANGSATTPEGIRNATGITSTAQAGASLTFADVVALYTSLLPQYRKNASFVTSDKGYATLFGLRDAQGRSLFTPDYRTDQASSLNLFGRPVVVTTDIPSNLGAGTNETEILFGDLKYYIIGDRRRMTVARTAEGGAAWTNDLIELRATERVDGKLTLATESFKKLTAVK